MLMNYSGYINIHFPPCRTFCIAVPPPLFHYTAMDDPTSCQPPPRLPWLTLGIGLALFALATRYGAGPWLEPAVATAGLLTLAALTLLLRYLPAWPGAEQSAPSRHLRRLPEALLLAFLLLYAASSAVTDNWFFPTGWKIPLLEHAKWRDLGYVRCLFATVGLALFFRPLLRTPRAMALAWIGLTGLALLHLHRATGFQMIYRVDSPAFVYRFWTFQRLFPRPDGFDPHWNAGMPVTALVASGVWSVGLWLLPFLHWFPAEQIYTPFLAVFFLGILPLLAWASLAWIAAPPRARWIAALLTLAPTQRYWVHLLHYGTAPALFAMSMAMPLSALAYRYIHLENRPRPATLLLLLLFGFTFLSWPGSLIIAAPLLLVLLANARHLTPRQWAWALGLALLLFLLLLPLALVPFRHATIGGFMSVTARKTLFEHLRGGWALLGHNLRGTNPIILIFGFLGGFIGLPRSIRRYFAPLALLLLLMSGWGEEVKKILQTERLIIPAALVAIIPASLWLDRLIQHSLDAPPRRQTRHALRRAATAWAVALLLTGAYQGAKTWNGKGLGPFQTMPDATRQLIHWLADNVPSNGRVLFAGRAVHGYGGAKAAALPHFTGREMMAADFYGFSPQIVEYQYPPRQFRYDGPDVLYSFMDLHNVTHIVTWHDDWKDVFRRTTNYYRPVHEIGRTAIFETRRQPSWFLEGHGDVQADFNRIQVTLDAPQDRVVIKYNWLPGFTSPHAKLHPHDAGRDITFIGLEPGTNRHITIHYRP
ncbi:MAG: hypothetical protein GX803_02565 [Lentisphaerae bacterium]|nr:hypothetical protein [Lentisphaerota bacterium]